MSGARGTGRSVAAIGAVALVLAALTACGSGAGGPTSGTGTASAAPSVATVVKLSRAHEYASVRELSAAAGAVVVATATAEHVPVEDNGGSRIPFQDTTMRVDRVIRGDVPSTFKLRQTHSADGVVVEGGDVEVEPGAQYVLWLGPTHIGDVYSVLGAPAGEYRVDGSKAARTDGESRDLPSSVRVADVVRDER